MRIELPDGQWAEIKGLDQLKAKDKVAVERAVVFTPNEDGTPSPMTADIAENMQIVMLSRVITDWSLQPPAPVTSEVLEELPIATYNALCEAITDHMLVIRANPNPKTPSA